MEVRVVNKQVFFKKRVPKQAGGVMFGYIKVLKLVMIRQEWETGIKHGDL